MSAQHSEPDEEISAEQLRSNHSRALRRLAQEEGQLGRLAQQIIDKSEDADE